MRPVVRLLSILPLVLFSDAASAQSDRLRQYAPTTAYSASGYALSGQGASPDRWTTPQPAPTRQAAALAPRAPVSAAAQFGPGVAVMPTIVIRGAANHTGLSDTSRSAADGLAATPASRTPAQYAAFRRAVEALPEELPTPQARLVDTQGDDVAEDISSASASATAVPAQNWSLVDDGSHTEYLNQPVSNVSYFGPASGGDLQAHGSCGHDVVCDHGHGCDGWHFPLLSRLFRGRHDERVCHEVGCPHVSCRGRWHDDCHGFHPVRWLLDCPLVSWLNPFKRRCHDEVVYAHTGDCGASYLGDEHMVGTGSWEGQPIGTTHESDSWSGREFNLPRGSQLIDIQEGTPEETIEGAAPGTVRPRAATPAPGETSRNSAPPASDAASAPKADSNAPLFVPHLPADESNEPSAARTPSGRSA